MAGSMEGVIVHTRSLAPLLAACVVSAFLTSTGVAAAQTSNDPVAPPSDVRIFPYNHFDPTTHQLFTGEHFLRVTWKVNSPNDAGFEVWNGNAGPYDHRGTGPRDDYLDWAMPDTPTWMCVKVRSYNNAYKSAWVPAESWACAWST
jgi:hypothetical protein